MIFQIYDYDSYERSLEGPATKEHIKQFLNGSHPPVQVTEHEVSEYEQGHFEKEPKAVIDSDGNPIIVWEASEEHTKKYEEWKKKGKNHRWTGDMFFRTVMQPIYGYNIETIEELALVLPSFEFAKAVDSETFILAY